MGHLLLSWISARLGFPIWKWFLWKTSHCCWLPIIVVGLKVRKGQNLLTTNPKSSLVCVRWKLLNSLTSHWVVDKTYHWLSLWLSALVQQASEKQNLVYFWFKVLGPASEIHREHPPSITETFSVSKSLYLNKLQSHPVRRWHHTEDLWLVCPKFNEERTSSCATPFDLVLGSNRSTLSRM